MAVVELRKLSSSSASSGAAGAAAQQLPLVRTGEETRCMWVDDSVALTGGKKLAIYDIKGELFIVCTALPFVRVLLTILTRSPPSLHIYDIKAGRSIGKISGCSWVDGALPSAASALAVDSTGQTVAVGHVDGSISVLYNRTRYS